MSKDYIFDCQQISEMLNRLKRSTNNGHVKSVSNSPFLFPEISPQYQIFFGYKLKIQCVVVFKNKLSIERNLLRCLVFNIQLLKHRNQNSYIVWKLLENHETPIFDSTIFS